VVPSHRPARARSAARGFASATTIGGGSGARSPARHAGTLDERASSERRYSATCSTSCAVNGPPKSIA
jgi:hypothetical protein